MTCDWARAALEHLDPAAEVSDALVEHLDDCAACRAALDARFPPAVQRPARASTTAPSQPVWGPVAVMAAGVAAVALLQLGHEPPSSFDDRIAMLDHSEYCVVVWEPPECEDP